MKRVRVFCWIIFFLLIIKISISSEPKLPKECIPYDIESKVRNLIIQLYSPDLRTRGESAYDLRFFRERSKPAIPYLISIYEEERLHTCLESYWDYNPGQIAYETLKLISPYNYSYLLKEYKSLKKNSKGNSSDHQYLLRKVLLNLIGENGPEVIPFLVKAIETEPDEFKKVASNLLLRYGNESIPYYQNLLKGDEEIQLIVATSITQHYSDKYTKLKLEILNTKSNKVKKELLRHIYINPPPELAEKLIELLSNQDFVLRDHAERLLIQMKPYPSPLLRKELKDKDDTDKLVRTISILNHYEDKKSLPAIRNLHTHPDPNIRIRVANALGIMHDDLNKPILKKLLHDLDFKVQLATAKSFKNYPSPDVVFILFKIMGDAESLEDYLVPFNVLISKDYQEYSKNAGYYIIKYIPDCSKLKYRTILLMQHLKLPSRRINNILLKELNNTDPDCLFITISTLKHLKEKRAGPYLIKFLNHSDPRLRCQAASTLSALKYTEGIEDLILSFENNYEYYWAFEGLVSFDKLALPYLEKHIKNENNNVKLTVIKALGRIYDFRTVPILLKALEDPDLEIKKATISALENKFYDRRVVEAVSKYLNHPDKNIRFEAIRILSKMKDYKSLEILVTHLRTVSESEERTLIIKNLLKRKDPKLLEYIPELKQTASSKERDFISENQQEIEIDLSDEYIIKNLDTPYDEIWEKITRKLEFNISSNLMLPLLLTFKSSNQLKKSRAAYLIHRRLSDFKTYIKYRNLDINIFLNNLSNSDKYVRSISITCLGILGDQTVIPDLYSCFKEYNPEVRDEIINVLEKLKGLDSMKLGGYLDSEDIEEQQTAILGLVKLNNNKYIDNIQKLAIESPYSAVRETAIYALGELKHEEALSVILKAAESKYPQNRAAAIRALGNFKNEKIEKRLIQYLNSNDPRIRIAAIEALGNMHSNDAIPILLQLLDDKEISYEEEIEIFRAFEKIKDPRILKPMLLRHNPYSYENYVVRKIAEHNPKEFYLLLFYPDDKVILSTLEGIKYPFKNSKWIIPRLNQLLEDDNPEVRKAAANFLYAYKDPSSIYHLGKALDTENFRNVETFFYLIEHIGSKGIPELLDELHNPSYKVKGNILYALSKFRDDRIIEIIPKYYDHENAFVRKRVASVIRNNHNENTIKYLIKLIKDTDVEVRKNAIYASVECRTPDVLNALIEQLEIESDAEVKKHLCRILGLFKDRKSENILINQLNDLDISIVKESIISLGMIKSEKAIPTVIQKFEKDPNIYRAVIKFLVQFNSDNVNMYLIKLAHSPNCYIRLCLAYEIRNYPEPTFSKIREILSKDEYPNILKKVKRYYK